MGANWRSFFFRCPLCVRKRAKSTGPLSRKKNAAVPSSARPARQVDAAPVSAFVWCCFCNVMMRLLVCTSLLERGHVHAQPHAALAQMSLRPRNHVNDAVGQLL